MPTNSSTFTRTKQSSFIQSPCFKCPDRALHCHSTCYDRYIPYKQRIEQFNNREKQENLMSIYYAEKRRAKLDKKLRYKKRMEGR